MKKGTGGKKKKSGDPYPNRLQLPEELTNIPLTMSEPGQTFNIFVGGESAADELRQSIKCRD